MSAGKNELENSEKGENHLNTDIKDKDMAYYCKQCQCWHYLSSDIWQRHKRYASKRPPKQKRTKKNFWSGLGRW